MVNQGVMSVDDVDSVLPQVLDQPGRRLQAGAVRFLTSEHLDPRTLQEAAKRAQTSEANDVYRMPFGAQLKCQVHDEPLGAPDLQAVYELNNAHVNKAEPRGCGLGHRGRLRSNNDLE